MQITEEIVRLLNFIGSLVCHQRQERTLQIGDNYLPVCARCTGAYIGLILGYLLLAFLRKNKARGPPDLYLSLIMMLPLWIDSFGQLFGLWISTNDVRLFSGLLFGAALAPMLFYVLSLEQFKVRVWLMKGLQPESAVLDSRDSWLDAKALLIGIALSGILFLVIRSLVDSEFALFYWVLSVPIIASIGWHFLVLPCFLLAALARRLFHGKQVTEPESKHLHS